MKIAVLLLLCLVLNGCQKLGKSLQDLADYKGQIFPMASTWRWTYKVVTFGGITFGANCQTGLITRAAGGSSTAGNRRGTLMGPICTSPGVANTLYSAEGDQVWMWNGSDWIAYLDAPLTEGHSFLSGFQTFTWYRPNSVSVPAGTFSDCWTKKDSKSDSFETFCRGIGLVSSYKVDAFGNGWKATLNKISGPAR